MASCQAQDNPVSVDSGSPDLYELLDMMSLQSSRFLPLIALGLGLSGSIASAQSGPLNAFALSLQDDLSYTSQPELVINETLAHLDSQSAPELGRSVVRMLGGDSPSRGGPSGLQTMESVELGRSQQGLQTFNHTTPKEDPLTTVPLPSAALAGFGLIAGIAGVRLLRNTKR